ncbi:MAG: peptide chain release factor N(5)-glutamine methyltransferase [Candidatus Gygaella obscura]|nr:peptide chain release factor N(5)-glutamine methyltransferase [Candidatus Gygaella obscura]
MKEKDLILSEILNCTPIDLYTKEFDLSFDQQQRLDTILEKRSQGVPLQHLLGRIDFYGLPFMVKEGVFIPRFETEILVEKVIALIDGWDNAKPLNILDVCSGTGNISIALARNTKNTHITAIDINTKAIRLSQENASLNNVQDKTVFLSKDIFKLQCFNKSFDVIVSNPPYLKDKDLSILSPEVLHDPKESIFAGDGFRFFRQILSIASSFLKNEAWIVFEIGHDQAEELKEITFLNKAFTLEEIIKDYNGFDRVAVIRYRKKNG